MTLDTLLVSDLGAQLLTFFGAGYIQYQPQQVFIPAPKAFRLTPGKRFYFNPDGTAHSPQYAALLLELTSLNDVASLSDAKYKIDVFLQGVYVPPPTSPSVPYRIDKLMAVTIDPCLYTPDDTLAIINFNLIARFSLP